MAGMENVPENATTSNPDDAAQPQLPASGQPVEEHADRAVAEPEFPQHVSATVRRGVNMRAFLVLGIIVGVITAIVLTYAFPEHPEFTQAQVLGFLLVFVTALSAIVFIGIGAIIDLIVGRKRRQIELTRAEGSADATNADSTPTTPNTRA